MAAIGIYIRQHGVSLTYLCIAGLRSRTKTIIHAVVFRSQSVLLVYLFSILLSFPCLLFHFRVTF